jgi:hypothetical protein
VAAAMIVKLTMGVRRVGFSSLRGSIG